MSKMSPRERKGREEGKNNESNLRFFNPRAIRLDSVFGSLALVKDSNDD